MQLDQNRIAIRERGYLEILDLALRVIRAYAGPLAAALAVGVVPAMLLNAWLVLGVLELEPETRISRRLLGADVLPGALGGPAGHGPGHVVPGASRCFPSRSEPRKIGPELRRLAAAVVLYQVRAAGAAAPAGVHLVRALCHLALPQRGDPAGAKSASSAAVHGG